MPPDPQSPRDTWTDALVENVQDIITLLDAEGHILWNSPSASRVLGYTAAELTGRGALDLVHPDDAPRAAALLAHAAATPGKVACIVFRFRHRDGSWHSIEAVGKNLLDHPTVRALVLTCRDVTDRVRAEAEAREAGEAGERAERASRAKSEFLARMSHELRTPLNAILGFAQLLEMQLAAPDQRESVAQILHAGRHLLHLVDEVLELSRVEEGRFALSREPVALADALRQAGDLLRPLAAKRQVILHVEAVDEGATWVTADVQALRQVLLNLLGNAIKYGGSPGEVRMVARRSGGAVRVAVCDSGPGIAPEKIDRLFTPFERLGAEASQEEGTGLGLALSRKLAELMGGSMGVRSEPGHGCEFWLELRAAAPGLPVDAVRPGSAVSR